MLRNRRWLAIISGVLVAAVLASPAGADCPPGGICPPNDQSCWVWGCGGGDDGGGNNGGGTGGGGGSGCTFQGQRVPCSIPHLGSYIGNGCYLTGSSIQPPPPVGGVPGGSWYVKSCFSAPNGDNYTQTLVWYDTPPAGAGVTPAQLAERALATITLKGAAIGIAPDPAGAGLVGLPVWLWTEVTPNTWGPITATASDGGLTVTITGKATSITWSMGDGRSVTCTSPGTPFQAGHGGQPSPDCGHVYQHASRDQPGGKYTVTATTAWRVDWSGGGQTGVINVTRTSQTTVQIDELQVVTQ